MPKTVLACTFSYLAEKLPGAPVRVASGDHPHVEIDVTPERCESALGRWLAENVASTVPGPTQTILRAATSRTAAEDDLRALAASVSRDCDHVDRGELRSALRRIEAMCRALDHKVINGARGDFLPRVIDYPWPLIDRDADGECITAELYFDQCAAALNTSSLAALEVVGVGAPPETIMRERSATDLLALVESNIRTPAVEFFWRRDRVPGWQLDLTEAVSRYALRALGKPQRDGDEPFTADEGLIERPTIRQYLHALRDGSSELPGRHFVTPSVWLSIINAHPPCQGDFNG